MVGRASIAQATAITTHTIATSKYLLQNDIIIVAAEALRCLPFPLAFVDVSATFDSISQYSAWIFFGEW